MNTRLTKKSYQKEIKKIEKEIKEFSKYDWYDRTLHDKLIKHCYEKIIEIENNSTWT